MPNYPVFRDVAVVGMHFREREGVQAKAIVSNFVPPVELTLEREPTNLYDAFALKVLYKGEHIGYIEATVAGFVSPLIDEGAKYSCTVQALEPRGRSLHPICILRPSQTEKAADEAAVAEPA